MHVADTIYDGRLEVHTRVSAGGGTVLQSVQATANGGGSKGVGGRSCSDPRTLVSVSPPLLCPRLSQAFVVVEDCQTLGHAELS
ncbi:hypothetical protein FF1_021495 [Malus domestica]